MKIEIDDIDDRIEDNRCTFKKHMNGCRNKGSLYMINPTLFSIEIWDRARHRTATQFVTNIFMYVYVYAYM